MNIFDAPKDTIRTNSGVFMNVFEPTLEMIQIEDIAHALASLPRFGGHLNKHYSVAQHSVMCAMRVTTLEDKRAALLHDASEAYMLDIPTPIKAKLPDYKIYEANLMTKIAEKFSFEFPLSKEVKRVDEEMLHLEWDNLVINQDKIFHCLSSEMAKEEFLKMYHELFVETVVLQ
jgi:5'-deoxynucleotidase YfbR-like HD superfamily hydrolase